MLLWPLWLPQATLLAFREEARWGAPEAGGSIWTGSNIAVFSK